MIILPKVKLEKVCGESDERSILQNPYLLANKTIGKDGRVETTLGQGTLMATNGFALAVLPVQHGDKDVSGPIPNATIKKALKDAKKAPATCFRETVDPSNLGRRYPRIAQIVSMRPREDTLSIALDADKLQALADAICERISIYSKAPHHIKLTFSTKNLNAPILVEPIDPDSEGFGLLMPMHVRV